MNRERRVRLAAGGVLALVFAAGTAVGFALGDARTPEIAVEPAADAARASPPDTDRERPTEPPRVWIIDRLELDTDQRSRVDSVVEHFGSRMTELQKDYRPRYLAVVDSTDRAIRAVLTDEQRARYDSMKAEAERRRAHERGHDPRH